MNKASNLIMLLIGVIQIIIGMLLIFANIDLVTMIFLVTGVAFLIIGIVQTLLLIMKKNDTSYGESGFISGALNLVIGLVLITKSTVILGIINIIVGIWIMINGITQISTSITVKRLGLKYWPAILFIGILVTVLGYLLITADGQTTKELINTYMGICLSLNGLGTILTAFFTKSNLE